MSRAPRILIAVMLLNLVLPLQARDLSKLLPGLDFEIVHRWPSDQSLFTQGLLVYKDRVYQSGGGYGRSRLVIRPATNLTGWTSRSLASNWFAEGIAVCNRELFLLTWRSQIAIVYQPDSLTETRRLNYRGQGWGLTCHNNRLLMSNGSATLVWRSANDFRIISALSVTAAGKPVDKLNELEWINNNIYANIWRTDLIVRIDPENGQVLAVLDLKQLLTKKERLSAGVLNGIAWDAQAELMLVTGKNWPWLFALKVPAIVK